MEKKTNDNGNRNFETRMSIDHFGRSRWIIVRRQARSTSLTKRKKQKNKTTMECI